MTIARPAKSEFAPYYDRYVGLVHEPGPLVAMKEQIDQFGDLGSLPEDQANHRYEIGKWTVKEVLGHLADQERVLAYRLTRIARGDTAPMAGFDQDAWAAAAPHRSRRIAEIAREMIAIRGATIALVESLDDSAVASVGFANDSFISARAICWILAGHTEHHFDLLRARYGVTV